MLSALRDDALTTTDAGFAVRLSLPWIRSLPLAALQDVHVALDGEPVDDLHVLLGGRVVTPAALAEEDGWWYLQDRLPIVGGRGVRGSHRVDVGFRLFVPYLPAGPDRPLLLPFRFSRVLVADVRAQPWAGRDVA